MKFAKLSRKIIAMSLAACMAASCAVTSVGSYIGLSTTVNAAETTASGFGYETNDDGTITITGYSGSDTEVIIPSVIDGKKVTEIGADSFSDHTGIKSVKIPDTVKIIGDYSFSKCTGLASVTIPDSVQKIHPYAFWNCTSLTEITIPDSVYLMGVGIFYGCTGLKSVKIPGSVTAIHYGTFYKCTGLTNVQIGDGITSISEEVFDGCVNLKSVTIPDSVTSIGTSTFNNCNKLVIYGNKGSYAETYAKNNGIVFAESLANNSTISLTTINKGESVILKAVATGGTLPYQYAFSAKHSTATAWTTLKDYDTTSAYVWTPSLTGTYQVCAKVKDSDGTEIEKFFTLTVKALLANNSTISKTTINKGESVTINASATGGTSPYQYAFTVKHSTATAWTTLKDYNTTSAYTWTPDLTGTYQICAKVKDSNGTEIEKFFTLTVNALLTNNSTISKTTINKGESVTLTATATGGTSPYQYAFSVKHSTSNNWTTIQSYSTTATKTWTPAKTGKYQVCAKIKDANGTEVRKFFTLTVNVPLTNNSTISKTTITTDEWVTLTGKETGGTAPYEYAYLYKKTTDTSWTTIRNYSTTSSVTIRLTASAVYDVCIKVQDCDNNTVKRYFKLTVNVPLANNSTISKTTINKGDSITLTAKATGGTSPYQYAFTVKHSTATSWTTIKSYNTTATKTWTPAKSGKYQVCAKVKDSDGTEVKKFFTLTINAPLENNSTISKTTITKGESVNLTGKASGGTAPYQYAFLCKHSSATEWTTLSSYHTSTSLGWTPAKSGKYNVCVKVKDANGTEVRKFFTLTISTEPLENNSTISTTTVTQGEWVTLKTAATGGTSPYQYQYLIKHSTATEWYVLKEYSTSTTLGWKPAKLGKYSVCLKVKDANGTEVRKFFTVTVQ